MLAAVVAAVIHAASSASFPRLPGRPRSYSISPLATSSKLPESSWLSRPFWGLAGAVDFWNLGGIAIQVGGGPGVMRAWPWLHQWEREAEAMPPRHAGIGIAIGHVPADASVE